VAEDTRRETEFNVVRGAVRVGRHPATLDRALRAGELPFRWEDGRRLVKGRDLDEWAARTDRRRATPPHPIMAEAAAL
jgi:hypothetical protein